MKPFQAMSTVCLALAVSAAPAAKSWAASSIDSGEAALVDIEVSLTQLFQRQGVEFRSLTCDNQACTASGTATRLPDVVAVMDAVEASSAFARPSVDLKVAEGKAPNASPVQFEISLKLDANEQRVYAIMLKHAASVQSLDCADGQCRVLATAANRESVAALIGDLEQAADHFSNVELESLVASNDQGDGPFQFRVRANTL